MQIPGRITTPDPQTDQERELQAALVRYSIELSKLLNNGLKFSDNFNAQIVSYTSHAVADTEDTIAHTLGRVPTGYLALHRSKAGTIYQGPATGTAWTATAIYVKSNVASTVFSLLIF